MFMPFSLAGWMDTARIRICPVMGLVLLSCHAAALTDGQPGTRVSLEGNATASVAVSKAASGAYLLLGRGEVDGVKVTAISGQQSRALGLFKGPVVRIPVSSGTTSLTISTADGASMVDVHEALLISK